MSKKKIQQEELIKTHVLNLNEIREAEKEDIKKKKKRIPIYIFIIGFLLILTGIITSIIFLKTSNEEEKEKKVINKNKLVCFSNFKDNIYNVSIHNEIRYTFSNSVLKTEEINSKITSNLNDKSNLTVLSNDFINNTFKMNNYNDSVNGVKFNIENDNKMLIVHNGIDYSKYLTIDSRRNTINSYLKVPVLNNKSSYDDVKTQSEKLGALCN